MVLRATLILVPLCRFRWLVLRYVSKLDIMLDCC